MPVGTVDASGVLWNTSSVGKFLCEPAPGMDTIWKMIESASKKYASHNAVGWRPVLDREMVTEAGAKFEKLTLADYTFIDFATYFKRIEDVASGLVGLTGLQRGDFVVIYAETQMEWMLCAMACWRMGLTVVTIYATLGAEGALHGVTQAKCKAVIADAKLLKVLAKIADQCPDLKHVVTITEEIGEAEASKLKAAGITTTALKSVEASGAEKKLEPAAGPASDVAVLMYTSGTTGLPKGVRLSHGNVAALVAATLSPTGAVLCSPELYTMTAGHDMYLCYLPLAHIMELAVEVTLLYAGCCLGYGSPKTLLATSLGLKQTEPPQLGDGAALKPTIMVFAPAVLDKVYSGVKGKIAAKGAVVGWLFGMALKSGIANFDNGGVGATNKCLDAIVFKKIRELLGGRVSMMLTGSAPLAIDVQKFVQSVFNSPVRQGYGLTETAAGTCVTMAHDNSPGVVGPPQECACIRLRDWEEGNYRNSDLQNPSVGKRRGEVLIGGPMVSLGYFVDPAAPDPEIVAKNKEEYVTLDGIRYFCTGDIGQITADGNLQIIDRKKDLVKLQQGEYVALSKVENVLKNSKFVELPMVYAESKMSYCIALICPQVAAMKAASSDKSLDKAALCESAEVKAACLADVKAVCKAAGLAGFETPTKVVLISELWTPENDLLTAAMKLKRKPIVDKHKAAITGVYV